MPVMLVYFEGNTLLPVDRSWDDFEHLVQHVSNQFDANEIQLFNTPICLTLQGEFEDEDMHEVLPLGSDEDDDEVAGDRFDGHEREEATIEEIMALEGMNSEDFYDDLDYMDEGRNDDEDDQNDQNGSQYECNDQVACDDAEDNGSFLNSSPAGELNTHFASIPDVNLFRPEKPDLSRIDQNAIVTDEDTKSLERAHKKADRLMSYAEDVKLIGSFHYAKKNYHLVKLLEPIVIVGQRIMDIKGYYFSLLDEEQTKCVTPEIERLLLSRPQQRRDPDMDVIYGDEGGKFRRGGSSPQRSKGVKKGSRVLTKSQRAKRRARVGSDDVQGRAVRSGDVSGPRGSDVPDMKAEYASDGSDGAYAYRSARTDSGTAQQPRGSISRRRWRSKHVARSSSKQ